MSWRGHALAFDLLKSHWLETVPQSWQLQAVCPLFEALLGNGCISPFHRMMERNSNTIECQVTELECFFLLVTDEMSYRESGDKIIKAGLLPGKNTCTYVSLHYVFRTPIPTLTTSQRCSRAGNSRSVVLKPATWKPQKQRHGRQEQHICAARHSREQ